MFSPKFKYTQDLIQNISEVERLYGKLEGMRLPKELFLNLHRNNLIQSSYSSNRIEGNPLTHAEVTNLLLDERIPTNRDEKEVKNYFQILEGLENKVASPLNTELVLETHRQLLDGVREEIKGQFRNASVVVGRHDEDGNLIIKHNPPVHTPTEIAKLLNDLFSWIENQNEVSIIKAGLFHHRFVYIHPFEDGNGRVCRLLTALLFLKSKYQINKYFVLDDYYDIDRDLYSDKLHSADSGDETEWLEYFTEGVKYSLQSALVKVENGLDKLSFDVRPTKKEKEVLQVIQGYKEISSGDLARELEVTRQQAYYLLRSLTEKGYIEQSGAKKGTIYKLK